MRLRLFPIVVALVAVACLMVAFTAAKSQRSNGSSHLLGEWKLLSVDNVDPDGTRKPRHGKHPAGLLIFDAHGHYSLIVLTEGTPEEYKAALEGNNADYGRYTVDPDRHAVTFYMDHASHSELEGSSHTRYYTVLGDRLTYTTVEPPADRKPKVSYGEVVFERVK